LKFILTFILLFSFSYAKTIKTNIWPKGESLITFLSKHNIPKDIYFNLDKEDKELCGEIRAGIKYDVAKKNNVVDNILIPIGEDIQIHIYKNIKNRYKLEIIPVIYDKYEGIAVINITRSPYEDIILTTNNYSLAHEFVRNFKKSFNFRKLQKNDKIAIRYIQKIRLGKYYGTPIILASTVQGRYKKNYVYKNPGDGRYYNEKAKSLTSILFKIPLRYRRISSPFSKKRWHPILHRYRAHHGIDYSASTGTRIWATAPGKIVFRGRKGGYGNTIEIQHRGGYKSLYAHQSRFRKGLKRGSYVKQGQTIGYVGSTGRSTGPHLHFGLYKNGRPINPAKVLKYSKTTLYGKRRKTFFRFANKNKKAMLKAIKNNLKAFKIPKSDNILFCKIKSKKYRNLTISIN